VHTVFTHSIAVAAAVFLTVAAARLDAGARAREAGGA